MNENWVSLVAVHELLRQFGEPLVYCVHEQVTSHLCICNNPNVPASMPPGSPYIWRKPHHPIPTAGAQCARPFLKIVLSLFEGIQNLCDQIFVVQIGEDWIDA